MNWQNLLEKKSRVIWNILMYDSLTVYTPPKSSLRVFFSFLFFLLFSPCHKHTHIHTSSFPSSFMICSTVVVSACGGFDIHGYACSSRICVLKKGCSSRPSFIPPLLLALSLLYILCTTYTYTYMYIYTVVHWSFFALALSTSLRYGSN